MQLRELGIQEPLECAAGNITSDWFGQARRVVRQIPTEVGTL